MLTGSNNSKLLHNKIDPEVFFMYQRWQELLDSRTLDMYQYNILNTCVSCNELYDVISKTISGLIISRQNIDDAKAEALEIIKNDDVLQKHNAALYNALLRIVSLKIESKQKNDNIEDKTSSFFTSLNRLKYGLNSPIRILNEKYMNYLLIETKNDVISRNNKATEQHISMIVSQCINNGWSIKGLQPIVTCFEGEDKFEAKWEKFCRSINPTPNKLFNIYYSVRIETKPGLSAQMARDVITSLGLNLKSGFDITSEMTEEFKDLYSKLKSDKYYIVVETHATDHDSAALSAINKLHRNLSVAAFFNTIDPWIANSSQIVAFSAADKTARSYKITDVFKTYDYVDSTNNVFDDTRNILVNNKKIIVMNRLNAAFSYTNLSRSSLFQETKYISLWIAFESVMRTGQYNDIISHIKQVLPEILAIRYFYRIIRNFSEDCIRCGYKYDSTLDIKMENTDKKALVTKLITIFRSEELYPILESHCQCNDLLAYRCKQISEILSNTQLIINKLEHYVKKIRWHIQRLYKIRNEITHSAFQDDKSLTIYIEHLFAYLSQLISEVVFYVEHKNVNSVEEAYSVIMENYKTYLELLRAEYFSNSDVLPNGIINIIE